MEVASSHPIKSRMERQMPKEGCVSQKANIHKVCVLATSALVVYLQGV